MTEWGFELVLVLVSLGFSTLAMLVEWRRESRMGERVARLEERLIALEQRCEWMGQGR
jgi:hypothetical protein